MDHTWAEKGIQGDLEKTEHLRGGGHCEAQEEQRVESRENQGAGETPGSTGLLPGF